MISMRQEIDGIFGMLQFAKITVPTAVRKAFLLEHGQDATQTFGSRRHRLAWENLGSGVWEAHWEPESPDGKTAKEILARLVEVVEGYRHPQHDDGPGRCIGCGTVRGNDCPFTCPLQSALNDAKGFLGAGVDAPGVSLRVSRG